MNVNEASELVRDEERKLREAIADALTTIKEKTGCSPSDVLIDLGTCTTISGEVWLVVNRVRIEVSL